VIAEKLYGLVMAQAEDIIVLIFIADVKHHQACFISSAKADLVVNPADSQ
jgi:hypothetical protein